MSDTSELRTVLDELDTRVGAGAAAGALVVAERVRDAIDQPRPTRRRSLYLVAAACATAAAVAVVPVVVTGRATHPGAPTPTPVRPGAPLSTPIPSIGPAQRPPLQFGFELQLPPGFVARPDGISADVQTMTAGRNASDAYTIQVHAPGSFVAPMVRQGERLTVGGHPGYYGEIEYPSGGQLAVIWQYAHDAWAVVSQTPRQAHSRAPSDSHDVRADELALANAVREGSTSMPVPFRLAAVPQGVVLRRISAYLLMPPSAGPVSAGLTLSNGHVADPATTPMDLMVQSSSFDHRYCTDAYWTRMTLGIDHVDQAELAGHPSCVLVAKSGDVAGAFLRLGPRYYVEIHVYPGHVGEFTRAQVEQLATGISLVADVHDTKSWLPATTALPH